VELSQLYPRGTKLAEVDPLFRGMPGAEWQRKMWAAQCDRWLAKQKAANVKPKVADSKIVTPRDEYGMKGLRGR
jgi:hypothetical protein